MPDRTCESYEGCCGRGWIYDLTDSGSGRTCYCDCAAGRRLRIEDEPTEQNTVKYVVYDDLVEESIHDRSERRSDEALRADGSER